MDIAVIGTSRKESEKRMPIHPDHIAWIPENIRSHLFFEKNYGLSFGMTRRCHSFFNGKPPSGPHKAAERTSGGF